MKRDGYVIEEIVERDNLEQSFDTVVRGTLRKRLREGKWLMRHREAFLDSVRDEILAGHVNLGQYHAKHIREGGKERDIQVFNMKTRIKVNAVMGVVDRHLRRRFIRSTSSSIKGRGMHELKAYIQRDIAQDPTGTRYVYKFDIRKFYETVQQDFVMYCVCRVFKDKRLIAILEQFVRLMPHGISMGLRSSQGMGNLLLSVFLDHYLKDRCGVRHFYRYCDDGVILSGSKAYLWECRELVHRQVNLIGQTVKPSERVFPITEGLDFLGFVIYPDHCRLRKRAKQTYARKLAKIKSRKRRVEIVGSFYGMAKHGQCRNLMRKLLTPSEMKKFSELRIEYTPADGKKRFPNKAVQLRQLVNIEIEVLDYEREVSTKYGLRWLVKFRDTRTNEICKFFTDCDEMKQALDAASGMGEIPFSTVIEAEYFGDNKVKYKFT